jgi:hypothetical protein
MAGWLALDPLLSYTQWPTHRYRLHEVSSKLKPRADYCQHVADRNGYSGQHNNNITIFGASLSPPVRVALILAVPHLAPFRLDTSGVYPGATIHGNFCRRSSNLPEDNRTAAHWMTIQVQDSLPAATCCGRGSSEPHISLPGDSNKSLYTSSLLLQRSRSLIYTLYTHHEQQTWVTDEPFGMTIIAAAYCGLS